MPYADGEPTLAEQIEEDERRRFYTEDLLKEARADAQRIKRLEAALDAIIACGSASPLVEKIARNALSAEQ